MGVGGKLTDCAAGSADTWTCKSQMSVTKRDGSENSGFPFKILGTDYDRWAVMYSCLAPMGVAMSMDFVWIYSRTQTLTPEELQAAQAVIRAQMPTYNLTSVQMYNTV